MQYAEENLNCVKKNLYANQTYVYTSSIHINHDILHVVHDILHAVIVINGLYKSALESHHMQKIPKSYHSLQVEVFPLEYFGV